jgi:hypothetical protein
VGLLDLVRHPRSPAPLPDSPVAVVAKGALAGFAGTLALAVVMKGAHQVEQSHANHLPAGP